MDELWRMRESSPVWISFENPTGDRARGAVRNGGVKGAPSERLAKGEEKVLCDFKGEGFLRRMWLTISDRTPEVLQGVRLRMWWDDRDTPAVDAPIGDFFCMGHGHMLPFENEFFSSPEGRSFNLSIPMPFRKRARVTLANLSDTDVAHLFYDINLTLESVPEDALFFHTQYRYQAIGENRPLEDEIVLAVATGCGRVLGVNVAVDVNPAYQGVWWGEGEVKVYLGDDMQPTLVGTGTEDYIGSAWGQGAYVNRFQGCTLLRDDAASFYRFHARDPIFFHEGCRMTLQDLGGCAKAKAMEIEASGAPMIMTSAAVGSDIVGLRGKDFRWDMLPDDAFAIFLRRDGFATVAYLYLDRP